MVTDSDYLPILNIIEARTGMALKEYRKAEALRTLEAAGGAPQALAAHLAVAGLSDPLWQALMAVITIGETYFFRNQVQFAALQNTLLPQLIARRRREGSLTLRLWSAGCATGEEPYSLAILLRQLLPDWAQWSLSILATDINQQFMNHAITGLYGENAFRSETPPDLRARWFSPEGRYFRLKSDIRAMVTFAPLNLIEDEYPSLVNGTAHMDIILCRNVTIYFSREHTQHVVNRMHRSLVPEGWYIVGHSEPQPDLYDGFALKPVDGLLLYQKPALARSAAPLPAAPRPPAAPPSRTQPLARPVERPEVVWDQAYAAAGQEDWAQAEALLARLEAQRHLLPHVYYLRGLIHLHHRQIDSALAALRQALYCDPDFVMAHCTMGDVYHQRQQPRQSRQYWEQALALVSGLEAGAVLPGSGDVTAEALIGLLQFRLGVGPQASGS